MSGVSTISPRAQLMMTTPSFISAIFSAFQTASGDTHPVHYDVEYCRSRGMPHLLAHGFQTLIHTAPGAGLFPFMVEDSLVGFLEQSSRFLKPVFADDTIYPTLEVTELVPAREDDGSGHGLVLSFQGRMGGRCHRLSCLGRSRRPGAPLQTSSLLTTAWPGSSA